MNATVCWAIQSHRDPEQVYRLVRTLRSGSRGPIVVRHDFHRCALDGAVLAEQSGVYLLPPGAPVARASFSAQAQPYLDVIDWLEREHIAYDWLVNVTGQDYPVTPVAQIEAFLSSATADGFLRYWDVLSAANPWPRRKARKRYWYRYRLLSPGSERLLYALRFLTKLLPVWFYLDYGPFVGFPAWKVPFTSTFRCYGGWAFFSLRRSAVLYLREFLASHPEVERHYRRTVAPEESLVQTVLVNSGRFQLVDDDLRYIDYSQAQRGSPRTLTESDFPSLAGGRYHFARKFDWQAAGELLDRIDREILGIGRGGPAAR